MVGNRLSIEDNVSTPNSNFHVVKSDSFSCYSTTSDIYSYPCSEEIRGLVFESGVSLSKPDGSTFFILNFALYVGRLCGTLGCS